MSHLMGGPPNAPPFSDWRSASASLFGSSHTESNSTLSHAVKGQRKRDCDEGKHPF